jgi:hypothetical protein
LFACCVESLNNVAYQIALLLRVFGQAFGFARWLIGVVLSLAKNEGRTHLCASHRINPPTSNAMTAN